MQEGAVIDVSQLIFHGQFPVGINHPAMGRPDKFNTLGKTQKKCVEIKAHITEIVFQWNNLRIKATEDHAVPALNSRHLLETQLFLAGFFLDHALLRNRRQFSRNFVRPVVIRADKALGIAVVRSADREAAMSAAVNAGVDFVVVSTSQNNRGFTHVGLHEITRIRDLSFMAKKQPGLTEDTFFLQLIDMWIAPGAATDEGSVIVNDVADRNVHSDSLNLRRKNYHSLIKFAIYSLKMSNL